VSMARHVAPGGLLIIEPWLTPTQYWRQNIKLDVSEAPGLTIARMYVGREDSGIVTNEEHYLIGEPSGVTHVVETNIQGLFSDDDYAKAFSEAGVTLIERDPHGLHGYGLYLTRKT